MKGGGGEGGKGKLEPFCIVLYYKAKLPSSIQVITCQHAVPMEKMGASFLEPF